MPTLIVEQPGSRTGGTINGRVLIGRLPTNGVALADSRVSRLHAWIDSDADGRYFVADGGSLTGTSVNGTAIEKRRVLSDGDVIRIGQAQIVFSHEEDLPDGVASINLDGQPPGENVEEAGVLFDCLCGAPAWYKPTAIGQSHQCRHCGRMMIVPAHSGVIAETTSPPTISEPGVRPDTTDTATPESILESWPDAPDAADNLVQEITPDEEGALGEHVIQPAARLQETDDSPVALETIEPSNGDSFTAHGISEEVAPAVAEAPADEPAFETAERPSMFEEAPAEGRLSEPDAPTHDTSVPANGELALEEPVAITDLAIDPAAAEQTCSICHTAIAAADAATACPSCGLTFHAECWQENLGCSAYGCNQVGILAKPQAETEVAEAEAEPDDESKPLVPIAPENDEPTGFPWEFGFLLMGVVGALAGAVTYGVPALIAALGTLIYLIGFQDPRGRRGVAIFSLLVCVVGTAAGVYVSYLWWSGWPPIGPLVHGGAR